MTVTPRRTAARLPWTLPIVLFVAAAGASCSGDTLTSPTSATQLNGTWRLFQMTQGGSVHNEDLNAGRFDVAFSADRIALKADCNTCAATSSLSGATLTVGTLTCTLAACASAPVDTRYTSVFSGPITVRINDRLLQLNSAQGELRFER